MQAPINPKASDRQHLETLAIHAGQQPDPTTGAVMPSISLSTTYAQEGIGQHKGYEYSRTMNPNREGLEANLAAIEGAAHGRAFSSGMAATHALMMLLKPGDHVVVTSNVYGGTYRLFTQVMESWGLTFSWVETHDLEATQAAMRDNTKMMFVETPTNPMLRLSDIEALGAIARDAGAMLVVDNTFATPVLQNPLRLGADVVMHSATKYLGGHSDIIGGALMLKDADVADRISFIQNGIGAVPSPFDAWLLLRSIKTLPLRVRQATDNAKQLAQFLVGELGAENVIYPGLSHHPDHGLAGRQMADFGGMVSAEFGSRARADAVASKLRVITLAESLGGVESLVCHPAEMTHASVPAERRAELGITEGLLRFSVGCEAASDLIDDVKQAVAG